MKKAVIFDFFGVISTEVAPFWFEERFSPDKAAELKEKYMGPSDRGEASEDETFAALSALSGERAEDIREDFNRRVKINPEMVKLIESLRGKYKTVLLSNAMEEWLEKILMKNDLFRLFDTTVISAKEKIAKPSAEIFRLALSRAGVSADEAVFIDDNRKNTDGAMAAGIDGIVFTGVTALKDELAAHGISVNK